MPNVTAGVVTCYVLDLDALAARVDVERARELLDGRIMDKYLDRAERVRLTDGKLRSLGVGLLLAGVLGIADKRELVEGEFGKPEPASGAYHLSISDAGTRAVVAVAQVPFGVDVEVEPEVVRTMQVRTLRRVGCDVPADVMDHPELMSPNEFCRRWTQVEAVLKAEGTGFAADPREHADWFEAWPCVWEDLPGHVLCAASHEQLPVRVEAVDPAALLSAILSA